MPKSYTVSENTKQKLDRLINNDQVNLAPIAKRGRKGGGSSPGGGTTILWAKITDVADANNYTVSIYNRSDESTAIETDKQCRVFDIVDQLAVNDWIPVQSSSITGEDYECIQQLGLL
jgi:hypothetical protein